MDDAEKQALLTFLANVRGATQTDVPTYQQPRVLRFIGMACKAVSDELASIRVDANPGKVMTEQARWLDGQMMELHGELFGDDWGKR